MASRRAARELAVQALYQLDMRSDEEGTPALAHFWGDGEESAGEREFARQLVEGVCTNRLRIDELIESAAEHWRLSRLSRVDLSVIRLGTFELFGRADIPTPVTINEAVEIARRFGSAESASFVNGVLDSIARGLGVKDRPGDEAGDA